MKEFKGIKQSNIHKKYYETFITDVMNKSIKGKKKSSKEDLLHSTSGVEKSSKRTTKPGDVSNERKVIHPLIEYWNSLPNTSKMRADTSTKTYKKAMELFDQLRAGKLGQRNYMDTAWMDKKGITERELSKKWSDAKIKSAMDELSKMLSPGYWPENKSWVPRNLNTLIYNPRSGRSWIMVVNKTPIKKVKQVSREREESKQPENVTKLAKRIAGAVEEISGIELGPVEMKKLFLKVGEIKTEHRKIPIWKHSELEDHIGTPAKFVTEYSKFLKKEFDDFNSLTVNMIGPGKRNWKKFINGLERDIGVSLKTGEALV